MSRILNFIKNNKGTIVLGVIFLIIGNIAFTSKNNEIKENLEKTYISQGDILKEKNKEIQSVDNNINSVNEQITDIKKYIDENNK